MFNIDRACNDDVEQIWELGKRVEQFITTFETVNFWPKNILQDCIDKDDVIINVAKNNDGVIGFIIANCNRSLKKAEIENIYVRPEHRNKGVGSSLLGKTVEDLNQLQFANICALESDAIEFYKKSDFIEGRTFTWMDLLLTEDQKMKNLDGHESY